MPHAACKESPFTCNFSYQMVIKLHSRLQHETMQHAGEEMTGSLSKLQYLLKCASGYFPSCLYGLFSG